MDIEQQIEKIVSKQNQLELQNKRLKQKFQGSINEMLKYNESKIKHLEENIRRLGERIGNIEKKIDEITLNKSHDIN